MDSGKDDQEQSMMEIIKSGELNSIYFNEFAIGVSKNDILILLRRNGKAEVVLNASHITAKSFLSSLDEALRGFEDKTNQKIPTSDEIEKLMEE
ncbi:MULTISPECIES: hypothetical protein [unclassified Nodularia (in: cyanobacteria)]|uniref:hypothetical protein n=1 Tax=unclassified Nodularia (in: cyanobacteria) TaxID=2656917 RepID=UPI00187E1387|nr:MULTISPECIES: hypothetical protein [unclassified Nodularia (in: cyanobacteria)]MBE9200776.1 hypothetical protein [Nodularia sp. LEGE 06071]MCC2695933.1 hypothetical protein [Nodularia sp. LEGE 04288]